MTVPQPPQTSNFNAFDAIDLYIDGLLSPEHAAAFEHQLEHSPELRRQLDLQDRANAELRSAFAYIEPSLEVARSSPTNIGTQTISLARSSDDSSLPARSAGVRLHKWRMYSLAAVLVLGCAGMWAAYIHLTTPGTVRLIPPQEIYAKLDAGGWVPEAICTTGPEFSKYVSDRLGQGLAIATAADLQVLGWSYGDGYDGEIVGEKTVVMLAKIQDPSHSGPVGVAVFIDKASQDRSLELPAGSPLRLFRKQVGTLVLYEITPLDAPRVITHISE